jgi:hypothetical protein
MESNTDSILVYIDFDYRGGIEPCILYYQNSW